MYGDFAIKYFEKEMFVIPLNVKTGSPLVLFKNVSIDEKIIESWSVKFPNAGIGLLCGKISGIIALDIDSNDKQVLDRLPASLSRKFGTRGETRFFKYNNKGTVHCKNPDIDIISDGNYTALPPMKSWKNGNEYVWRGQSLLDISNFDLPDLFDDVYDFVAKRTSVSSDSNGGRHNKLVSMALAMHAKGKGNQQIAEELFDFDKKNHAIPYFTDESEAHKGKGFDCSVELVLNTAKTAIARKLTTQEVTIGIQHPPGEIETEESEYDDDLPKLPKLSGLMQEIFQYIYSNSPIPRSRFAWASSISLMSVLIGNKYSFMGVHPNIITLLLAPSGYGKDAPLSAIKELLFASGMEKLIGQSDYASDIGIVAAFPIQRKRIDVIDEAALLFKSGDKLPHQRQGIIHSLSKVWSATGKIYEGRTRQKDMDDPKVNIVYRGRCFSPFLSLLAATTFSGIEDSFDKTVLETGLGGRCLYFPEERYKRGTPFYGKTQISSDLKSWMRNFKDKEMIDANPNPLAKFDIPDLGIENMSRYNEIWEELAILKENKKDNMANPIYQRASENWHKFCLLHHCSYERSNIGLSIKSSSLDWGYEATLSLLKYGDYTINKFTCKTGFSKLVDRVYSIISKKGSEGIMRSNLYLKTQRFVSKGTDLQDIISQLKNSGKIQVKQIQTKGRAAEVFFAVRSS